MKAHSALFEGRAGGEPKNEALYYSSLQLTYTFKTRKIDLLLDNSSSFFLICDCSYRRNDCGSVVEDRN